MTPNSWMFYDDDVDDDMYFCSGMRKSISEWHSDILYIGIVH